ncbi:ADP-ribose 1''-phosphate phosphatase [Didymella heteroderae]|uniref:ADP-ribose 1''-phosphate phosphatase n=1 Tax=Didymella heteroderae TaxID=1769908 RepID=A0A9P5C4A9_9PLEO|nr:ADP-ribose 1''-phosphate phosphatase [Didymella heteroderae]
MSSGGSQSKSGTSTKTAAPEHKAHKRAASKSPPPPKKQKTRTQVQHEHLDYTHVPSGWLDTTTKQDAKQQSLQLTYHQGDMFADVPPGIVLVHACNTQGHWGAGIAKAFKQHYPVAYADHNKFCTKDHTKSNPVATGTAQLLAPRDGNQQHWIGCLFTSAKYGKGKDKPDQIVTNTANSVPMLLELISQVGTEVTGVRMCKINSGKFGVPWEKTEEVLKDIKLKPNWRTKIEVWEPEGE